MAQIEAAGSIYYVHDDHLGTPQKMTDGTQVIVWDRQQDPFGETLATTGTASSSLRFPGQFADPESGLNYNLMRDYDPTLGRYIEADPFGLVAGLNLYGYANQNPALYTDPRGETAGVLVPIGIAALALTAGAIDYMSKHPNTDITLFPNSPSDEAEEEAGGNENICTPANSTGANNRDPNRKPECEMMMAKDQKRCDRAGSNIKKIPLTKNIDIYRARSACFGSAFERYAECRSKGFENVTTPLATFGF